MGYRYEDSFQVRTRQIIARERMMNIDVTEELEYDTSPKIW